MKRLTMIVSVLGLFMATGQTLADGDAAKGKAKAAMCAGCHGPDGNSVNPLWPKLAGQHAAYLVKQLQAFKGGQRNDPMMKPMVAALSEVDMQNLAAFYASQKQK